MVAEMTARARSAAKRVGTVLRERWTLDTLIGVGGMAAVYKATHRNGNEVAVKVLHPDIVDDSVKKRFQREGYVANRVKHRSAVTVFDDDVSEDGAPFLVMELLYGENIEERRERLGGVVPLPEVLGIADQVLDALAAAHAQGIIHRDVKPENLFLTTDGVVKVLDFGIARLQAAQGGTSLTMVGAMLGTPGFLAPEQARGMTLAIDHQTDLWAVGATMFTLLCGRYVQEAQTEEESMALAATTPARSLASLLPDLDREVVALVDRALAWEKHDRFADALGMQEELRRVASRVLSGGARARLELDEAGALSGPVVPSEREPPTRVLRVPDPESEEETRLALEPPEGPTLQRRLVAPPPKRALPLPPALIAVLAAVLLVLGLALGVTLVAAVIVGAKARSGPAGSAPPASSRR